MYSTIRNVQYVVAVLKAYNIKQVVLSPGSRNAPLIHSFASDPFFDCLSVVDERNAAFQALGIIQRTQSPVVICCTSGSALLDYSPAVAEAFYQHLPLIVLSADRPVAWVNQLDGQTIAQYNALANYVKKTVQLPEIKNSTDEWYCERLLHDAILTCFNGSEGAVHINVPISEPLFDFSAETLPFVKVVNRSIPKVAQMNIYKQQWNQAKKRMIVVGQHTPNTILSMMLEKISSIYDCVILAEQISNLHISRQIENFDTLLHHLKNEDAILVPDLLIYVGGHIVSKRLKHFLRKNNIAQQWRISEDCEFIDLFQGITEDIKCDCITFFSDFIDPEKEREESHPFFDTWTKVSRSIAEPNENESLEFSDLLTLSLFTKKIPKCSSIFVANSSVVRNIQLFKLDASINVYCNRGVNGIDGAIATTIGIARKSEELVFLIIGDLSFFYDIGSLASSSLPSNLRILLLNNGGGAIFSQLPVPNKTKYFNQYVSAEHSMNAGDFVNKENIMYLQATNKTSLTEQIDILVKESIEKPILLEVLTDNDFNTNELKSYYNKK